MSRALLAGDSMVKYVGQYFPSHQGLAVEVSAHRGAKIEHLLPMIVNKLGSFDVIVHVCTNNTLESVDVYIDKYRRLARDIIASNPRAQVAFSAIFPRGQNEYRMREAQSAKLRRINERYKEVNAALQELCQEQGFHFMDGLVEDWASCLARDGVLPSRHGNQLLADYYYREARILAASVERGRIQRNYQDRQSSSWSGWAEPPAAPVFTSAYFPPLGANCTSLAANKPYRVKTTPGQVTSPASLQACNTDQLPCALRGSGFVLVGAVRVRSKGSKTWCTRDSLPSPMTHVSRVPRRGKAEGRLQGHVPFAKPVSLSQGASTTCSRVMGGVVQASPALH